MGIRKNMGLVGPKTKFGPDSVLLCKKEEISQLVSSTKEQVFSLVRSNKESK